MKQIYKKISLAPLRCYLPNTLIAFDNEDYIDPSVRNFYIDYPHGNYGMICSDITLPKTFTGIDGRIYDFSTVTEMTSSNILLPSEDVTNELGLPYKKDYAKLLYSGTTISCDDGETYKRYFTYSKLHSWYRFFVNYFHLLYSTSCEKSEKAYKSAEERYYSPRDKEEWETLDFCQELDAMFIARGGKINDTDYSGKTHCDLFDWFRDYIFIRYDMNQEQSIKPYLSEWKCPIINVVQLMDLWKWFNMQHDLYGDIDDCISADTDSSTETDCCECNKYKRLGGNDMYEWLKECVKDYRAKVRLVRELCTYTACANIPIQIQGCNNILGEMTPWYETWEGGIDYYNSNVEESNFADIINGGNLSGGTVVYYSGEAYKYDGNDTLDDESKRNDTIYIQDNIFIASATASNEGYEQGYKVNSYQEKTFIHNGQPIYNEYLPEYINKNIDEFHLKDLEELSKLGNPKYAYLNGKMVYNPTYDSMNVKYGLYIPSTDNHIFYIEDNMYVSFTAHTLVDYQGKVVSGSVNPILISYTANNPYIEYRDKYYFGVWEKNQYVFYLSNGLCKKPNQYYISEDTYEFITRDNILYRVQDGKVLMNNVYYPYIDGYVYYRNQYICVKDNMICEYDSLTATTIDDVTVYNTSFKEKEKTVFGTRITDKTEWDELNLENKTYRGYWVENNNICYIEPYKVYDINYVTGTTRSRLDELHDYNVTQDREGNTLSGLYCGNRIVPTDKDIFDIYYHIGQTHNTSYISTEAYTDAIVYGEQKSEYIDYYWGDLISNIILYYKNDDDEIIVETVVSGNTYYTTEPDWTKSLEKNNNNLEAFGSCADKYIQSQCRTIEGAITADTNGYSGEIIIGSDGNYYQLVKVLNDGTIDNYMLLDGITEIFNAIPHTMYFEVIYNKGAILQRPYFYQDSKPRYGMFTLTKDYHKGVEYQEIWKVSIEEETYYAEKDISFPVQYYALTPTEEVTYYMDEVQTDDSEAFTSNKSRFSLERIYDLTQEYNGKAFSKEINSSDADGRCLNFYNGEMVAPNIMKEYNLGISSLRNINDNIYINRGINYAFDKHLKLLEVKTLEALEQYNNGFYNIKSNTDSE